MSEPEHDWHFYQPVDGHGLRYDPLNAIVGPRPIGWISTVDEAGGANLAPYSFFNVFNYVPPIIGFSSIGMKHTLENVLQTGEFCWNLAVRPLAEAVSASSATFPRAVDEFEHSGVTKAPSRLIRPPRVAESPVSFECRVAQIVQLADIASKPLETWLVLGEVIGVHIRQDMLLDGIYQTGASKTVMRGGGPAEYFEVLPQSRFLITRPA
ncbi:flavin reductase family protein [Devosia sp. A369]